MYGICGIVMGCYLTLGILSRKEVVERHVCIALTPFYKIAVYLYKRACIRKIPLFSSGQVERDLRGLHPGEGKERLNADYYIKKISMSLAIVFVGTLFGMLVKYNSESGIVLDGEGSIGRGSYKEGDREVRLRPDCAEGGSDSFRIKVAPLWLTGDEAQTLLEEFWGRLPEYILGENKSLEGISSDLVLEEHYGDYPFVLEWNSPSPAIVGSGGRVYPVEEPVLIEMEVRITYGEMVWEEVMPLFVVPAEPTAKEQAYEDMERMLLQSEYDSRGDETWRLPEEWRGEALHWRQEVEDYSVILWIMAIVTAVLAYIMADQDLHTQLERQKKRMQKDYPDIVHKLVLYVGAGITIRGAFQKIAGEYEQKRREDDFRPAYEQMLYTCRELQSGVSESNAYEHFGKRTGLQEYIRLSTLLAQNLKKGNSTLLERLREEADKAGEERLQNCKRLGEEAGTKLLIPMVLMLAVVMVMIIIPAFSSL